MDESAVALSPISAAEFLQLEPNLRRLSPNGLLWLSGYCAGLAANEPQTALETALPNAVVVVFASQTGNAKRLAERYAQVLTTRGITATLKSFNKLSIKELKQTSVLWAVVSTQGDGEPPDDSRDLLTKLQRSAESLDKLRYAVLALGDSSYPKFCETGRQFEEQLQRLGAQPLSARVDCDVDFEDSAVTWMESQANWAERELKTNPRDTAANIHLMPTVKNNRIQASRDAPLALTVSHVQPLTSEQASQRVLHVELALPADGFAYQAGDSLGVYMPSSRVLVEQLLAFLSVDSTLLVTRKDKTLPITTWLTDELDITRIGRGLFDLIAQYGHLDFHNKNYAQLLKDNVISEQDQPLTLLTRLNLPITAHELVNALLPKTPRLYSISSDPQISDAIHLTVAVVEYAHQGTVLRGHASASLADAKPGSVVAAFIEPNERFRLPQDPLKDVIVIGAGTGIAPFRAFLQARQALQQRGRFWVFFGTRQREHDFLYQTEWLEAIKTGEVERFSAAFSRDQAEKIYVQDRLREASAELWQWLSNGAYLYVCGKANPMARDVHQTLVDILCSEGQQSQDSAELMLQAWAAERRYLRDVY